MTYINNEKHFNSVRLEVSSVLHPDNKNLIYGQYENVLAWAPVVSSYGVIPEKRKCRPLLCTNPFTGKLFTTEVEAREYVSEALKLYSSKKGGNTPYWKKNIEEKQRVAFSLFLKDFGKEKSLYVKFHLLYRYVKELKRNTYVLKVLSFHPSYGF